MSAAAAFPDPDRRGVDLDSMTLDEAAVWYSSRGIPIFPLLPRSKNPRKGSNGFKDATCDIEQVRAWWRENPRYNIGIPCGEKSGLLVLDIDPRHGGDAVVEGWIAKYGPWPPTAEVVTGSGGRHVFFRYEPGVRSCTVADGVEIKSDGTYVVASPSIHPETGRRYSFDGTDGAEALNRLCHAPGWLLRLAREKRPKADSAAAPGRKIPAGRRNVELTSIAGVLRSRGAGEAELRDLLSRINQTLCDPPLRPDEVERIAASVARYEPRAENERPDAQRIFERLDEGRYRMMLPGIASELEVDLLRREDGNLVGELIARCHLPGNRGVDGLLSIADFNLSSARARVERAKLIAARANTPAEQVDWMGIIEDFSQKILLAEREGSPAVVLADVPLPDPDDEWETHGFPLLKHHSTILFGDGGCAKSYLALWFLGALAKQGIKTLFCDWELDEREHRRRLELLGLADRREIHYLRCSNPLTVECERIRRIVREHGCEYIVLDSILLACDGPAESAEVAGRYFRALRRIGTGSLSIAHISKGEGGDQKPFGSSFWHNSARATFNIKRADSVGGENITEVAIYQRKANLKGFRPPMAYSLRFEDERTIIRRADIADIPELAGKLSIPQRMAAMLRRGPMTTSELAAELEVDDSYIRTVIGRKTGIFLRLPDGRVALAARRRDYDRPH